MSDGGKQFWSFNFGTAYPGVKIYHYSAGTTTLKDVYFDEGGSTSHSQPYTGDSRGVAWFYGDGNYRFVITDSDGAQLYDWDNIKISSDTGTMWEGNSGTAFPSAETKNKWQMFSKHNASDILLDVGVNQGDKFVSINSGVRYVESYSSFAAAITDIGSSVVTLAISTSQTVSANVTIPETLTLMFIGPGQLSVNESVTITMNGHIISPLKTIFTGASTSPVKFGQGSISECHPQWFGKLTDGDIIQKSVSSLSVYGGSILLPLGSTDSATTIDLPSSTGTDILIRGHGRNNASGSVINITQDVIGITVNDRAHLEDFMITTSLGDGHTKDGIQFLSNTNHSITNVWVYLVGGRGIDVQLGNLISMINIRCSDCKGDGIRIGDLDVSTIDVNSGIAFQLDLQVNGGHGLNFVNGDEWDMHGITTQDNDLDGVHLENAKRNRIMGWSERNAGDNIHLAAGTAGNTLIYSNDAYSAMVVDNGSGNMVLSRQEGASQLVQWENFWIRNLVMVGSLEYAARITTVDLDTTPDVSKGNYFYIGNSGTTYITDFDWGGANITESQVIVVRFGNSNSRIIHGANTIRLKGAVNYGDAATGIPTNTTMMFIRDDLRWHEISRSEN